MNLTYYGHSCFMLHTGSHRILFDPFIRNNSLASSVDVDSLNPNFICLSHGHADHIADCLEIAGRSGALVICNWEIHEWLNKLGITNTHPMNAGGWISFEFGRMRGVSAVHSSSLPDGSYGGSPLGFVLETGGKRLYYAGDTALTMDMKLIGQYWPPDLALLPIGSNFTMDAHDAMECSDFIGCQRVVGMHYDTFGFIVINKEEAKTQFEARGKHLLLPAIGESLPL